MLDNGLLVEKTTIVTACTTLLRLSLTQMDGDQPKEDVLFVLTFHFSFQG